MSGHQDNRQNLKKFLDVARINIDTAIRRVDTTTSSLAKLRKPVRSDGEFTVEELATYSNESSSVALNKNNVC